MTRLISVAQFKRHFFFIIVLLFVFLPCLLIIYQQQSILHEFRLSTSSHGTRYERFCRQINESIKFERPSTIPIKLNSTQASIPYLYSQWQSTSEIPRLLIPCEHAIYMHLLSILIEHVFKKYNIQYMMMAATLLGSYTHHDLLPWDDDVDLRVSISDRHRLQSIIIRELASEPYSIIIMQVHTERNCDKVFFTWCPHAGTLSWRFPFIDIFYHDQNSTHVWLLGEPRSCPVRHEDVFPLVLRPFGSLWLYGPRQPMAHFESRKMIRIESGCYSFPYSHKYEHMVRKDILAVECSELKSVYPYVERQCTSEKCTEYLKLGNQTIIHTVIYNYAYRTFLYAEMNQSYTAC